MEQRLNAGDEHLILASQGVWDVVSPDDAALRLHFHLKASVMKQPCMEQWHALLAIFGCLGSIRYARDAAVIDLRLSEYGCGVVCRPMPVRMCQCLQSSVMQ